MVNKNQVHTGIDMVCATNFTLRGKQIVLADFDTTRMADCIYEAKLDYQDVKKEPYIDKLHKLSRIKWLSWQKMVYTYFTDMKNS